MLVVILLFTVKLELTCILLEQIIEPFPVVIILLVVCIKPVPVIFIVVKLLAIKLLAVRVDIGPLAFISPET